MTINYDQISNQYDERYRSNNFSGVKNTLLQLAVKSRAVLEVGCGTGRWLKELSEDKDRGVLGLDLSLGMLKKAHEKATTASLVCGNASHLPFGGKIFDLVYCVNAFHHFESPRTFLVEARRVLRGSGALAVIGPNPHREGDRWYIYDYFPETRTLDLARFPSSDRLCAWMRPAGFF